MSGWGVHIRGSAQMVLRSGLMDQSSECRVYGQGLRVYSLGFRVKGLALRV